MNFTSLDTQLDPQLARLVEWNESGIKKPSVEWGQQLWENSRFEICTLSDNIETAGHKKLSNIGGAPIELGQNFVESIDGLFSNVPLFLQLTQMTSKISKNSLEILRNSQNCFENESSVWVQNFDVGDSWKF